MPIKYECVLCKESIEVDGNDPCALILNTNTDKSLSQRKEQTFYCHFNCMKATINSSCFYLEDLSTPEEIEKINREIDDCLFEIWNKLCTDKRTIGLIKKTEKGLWNNLHDMIEPTLFQEEISNLSEIGYEFKELQICWTEMNGRIAVSLATDQSSFPHFYTELSNIEVS